MTLYHTAAGPRTIDELERLAYCAGMTLTADLCENARALDGVSAQLEREYETREEQSEFRRQLLEDIQRECREPRTGAASRLAEHILALIANSSVEL